MLITRKSPRRSKAFRSRFSEGNVDFPIRQYLRCRDEIYSGIIHAILLLAFLVALVYFGKTLWQLFARHGAELSPWYRRGAMTGMTVMILFVALRFWLKVRNLREVRDEMKYLKSQLPTARNTAQTDQD
jgi:hypothetical protein